jgi:hypothetical protein
VDALRIQSAESEVHYRVNLTRCPYARATRADSSELCDRAAPSRPTGSSRLYGCGRRRHILFRAPRKIAALASLCESD